MFAVSGLILLSGAAKTIGQRVVGAIVIGAGLGGTYTGGKEIFKYVKALLDKNKGKEVTTNNVGGPNLSGALQAEVREQIQVLNNMVNKFTISLIPFINLD